MRSVKWTDALETEVWVWAVMRDNPVLSRKLPERDWRILQGHARDGRTFRELATQEGISNPRAQQILHAVLRKAQSLMRNPPMGYRVSRPTDIEWLL